MKMLENDATYETELNTKIEIEYLSTCLGLFFQE